MCHTKNGIPVFYLGIISICFHQSTIENIHEMKISAYLIQIYPGHCHKEVKIIGNFLEIIPKMNYIKNCMQIYR